MKGMHVSVRGCLHVCIVATPNDSASVCLSLDFLTLIKTNNTTVLRYFCNYFTLYLRLKI